MLFDLRGKRKRVVQAAYIFLALLMGGGLVVGTFGATGSGGGLLDSLFGGGRGGGGSNNYDKQATQIERQLARHPNDPALLLKLARARILAGDTKSPVNSATGRVTYSQDSLNEFQRASDAWERYLKTRPPRPDTSISLLVANAYVSLAQNETSLTLAIADIKGAEQAQKVYTDAKPSLGTFAQLAIYAYLGGDLATGDHARDQALKRATSANRVSLKTRLKQARDQGVKLAQQVKLQAKLHGGKQQLQNPLGGLSGGGSGGSPLSSPPGP